MLIISKQIIDELISHAQNGLPEEVCGYLAGNNREISKRYGLTNIDHSPEHFSLDPTEQFQAVREARKAGLEILANYHSHPTSAARPSDEDIRLAFDSNISYVIVSLEGETPEIKSYRIKNGRVEPEEIKIAEQIVV